MFLFYLVSVIAYAQQHQHGRLSFEEMGNVLLDVMQGILLCLDNHHVIINVSNTIKRYFGFEQVCHRYELKIKNKIVSFFPYFPFIKDEIVGHSILLLIEDSERDSFAKFLSSTLSGS